MKLKLPGPNGIITLASDPDVALRVENKTAALVLEALSEAIAAEELRMLCATMDRDDVILDKRPKSTSFKPADEIVKFQVHPTDPTKTASIGTQLNPQWTPHCENPYARILTFSPCTHRTCQASHAGWTNIASIF